MKTGLELRAVLAASVAMGVFAVPAYAQDSASDEAPQARASSDIIVTAQRREQDLLDVPVAVTVATAEQLERDQVRQIADLSRIAPAVEVSQSFGGELNGGGRVRGLGTGVFNSSVSPSTAFVVDQVPQGNLAFPLLFDLAQVEVLRGPQGTLFGQGASAGVINVNTKAPSLDGGSVSGGFSYADKGTAGSENGELTGDAAVNVVLADAVAFRLAARYQKETGLQENVTNGDPTRIASTGVRGRLLVDPDSPLTITLTGEYAEWDRDEMAFFAIAKEPTGYGDTSTNSLAAYTNPDDCAMPVIDERAEFFCSDTDTHRNDATTGFSGIIEYELSDVLTLTSVTAYRWNDRRYYYTDYSRITTIPAARDENYKQLSNQFSEELRLTYGGDGLDVVGGVLYSKFNTHKEPIDTSLGYGYQDPDDAGFFGYWYNSGPGERTGFSVCLYVGGFCPVGPQLQYEESHNNIWAFFGDATFAVSDQLDIFGGLRYSMYENTTGTALNSTTPTNSYDLSENKLSGRIGFSFKPSPFSNIYGSYARGYKPGAVVVLPVPTTSNPDGVVPLDPEEADAVELGGRVEVDRITLSGNIFWNRVKGFQAQQSVFVGTALISQALNLDHVTSKGFEIGAFGNLGNLNINAGYQFNDITYPEGSVGDDGGDLSGQQFLNAPKHKFTLSGEYYVPVGSNLEAFVNGNFVYKSAVLYSARTTPEYKFPGHETINLGAGVRGDDGGWSMSVFVRNLTKSREPIAYLASTFGGAVDGGVRAWPAAGVTTRVVGVMGSFSF